MLVPLFFRCLEDEKSQALKANKGNFDIPMCLNRKAEDELAWWITNASNSYNVVSHGEPDCIITTDASSTGWDCTLGKIRSGGSWTIEEAQNHINYLELFAVFLALQTFEKNLIGKHVSWLIIWQRYLTSITWALVNLSYEMIWQNPYGSGAMNDTCGSLQFTSRGWIILKLTDSPDYLIPVLNGHLINSSLGMQ